MSVSRTCAECGWEYYLSLKPLHLILHGRLPSLALGLDRHPGRLWTHHGHVPRDVLAVLLHAFAMSRRDNWRVCHPF